MKPAPLRVYIGHDAREQLAFDIACESIERHASKPVRIEAVGMGAAAHKGLYWRPTHVRYTPDGKQQLWDVISDAPMSTAFSIARFLVPHLAGFKGWAVFCDCDFLFRADIAELFALGDERYAVQVVKHHYVTGLNEQKMDSQANPHYRRKNWSSLVLWNCGHPANRQITPEYVNAMTGRELHAFCWLADDLIGGLPFEWNWLELEPKAVHFTRGTPDMPGWERVAYAEEFRSYQKGAEHGPSTDEAEVEGGGDAPRRRQGAGAEDHPG